MTMPIPRFALAFIALLSLPVHAGDVVLSGAKLTLPDAFVSIEEKRELKSKDRFVHEISSTQTFRNALTLEGDNRVVLKVIIRHMPAIPMTPVSDEKLAESLKSAVGQRPNDSVLLLPFGSTRGLFIDEAYAPPAIEGKPEPRKVRFASISAIASGARVEILFMYPPSLIAQADALKMFQTMKIDEAGIKQMIVESDGIRKAAVTGNKIQTQAGAFDMPLGSAIQFGTLSMTRSDAGTNVMTNFFVQKDGFWTSQRAGVVISCLPGGVSVAAEQEKMQKTILEAAKVQMTEVNTQRQKLGTVDTLKAKYSLSGLDTTSWFVFGKSATLVATLMGITTDKFQQQFEKSPAFTQAQCARIPGSQLESAAAAL
jgi:hypothetical protein